MRGLWSSRTFERSENRRICERRQSEANQLAAVLELVAKMHDPNPCRLDEYGRCQEHLWFGIGECPQAALSRLMDLDRALPGVYLD